MFTQQACTISAIEVSKIADPDQTRRLVWVYTLCICPKVPFRITLTRLMQEQTVIFLVNFH